MNTQKSEISAPCRSRALGIDGKGEGPAEREDQFLHLKWQVLACGLSEDPETVHMCPVQDWLASSSTLPIWMSPEHACASISEH